MLLLALGANVLLAAVLAGEAGGVLRARAEAAASTVQVAADGTVTVLDVRDDQALDVGTWIFDARGSVVERPPGGTPALEDAAARLALGGEGTGELGGVNPVRLLALPVVDGGERVAVVVTSTSLAPYQQVERLAVIGSIGAAVLLITMVHLVLRANVTRALRPVQQMSAQAGRWSADDVERRFGVQPRPAELAELAGTLDQLLDRLSAVLRHERRFAEELSHELRTPLAQIQAEVDLLSARPRSVTELRAAHAAIDRAAAGMRSTLDTLMSTARSGSIVPPGRSFVAPVLRSLATARDGQTARPDGDKRDVVMDVAVPEDLVAGVEADVLLRVLSPIVENAVRYASAEVRLSASNRGGRVAVVVTDDGPGMTPDVAARAFDPGFRGDAADGHDGAGLGLALVRRLVLAIGGRVEAKPSTHGGHVELVLPAA
ncbi:HAMP domain-containing sensor histidine kinase [Blastococcus sp. CT_GayMR16]|uniref:sensor histidine kinase n=1 Tax=Blastococcus sp. CT_GayMR16 TaxID=2559607 RepID=UPI0010739827|nr:HAMP domain-containing sensor histidine kinase [Blastococcus sp. CT_GayMR16]TFV91074.1 HAMP domain-containing histidine kinase [Blastococcus sp. CT_GayMR16]